MGISFLVIYILCFRPKDSASKRCADALLHSVLASDSGQPYAGEWTKWHEGCNSLTSLKSEGVYSNGRCYRSLLLRTPIYINKIIITDYHNDLSLNAVFMA